MLKRINCRSENSKGVYCLQYDDNKIVSGLRDNTIKIWDRSDLKCVKTLMGHTGSVLCLQYDDKVIISGSSDSTVRVWDVKTAEMVHTIIHHSEAVLHLRFNNGMMVTCSKVNIFPLFRPFGSFVCQLVKFPQFRAVTLTSEVIVLLVCGSVLKIAFRL